MGRRPRVRKTALGKRLTALRDRLELTQTEAAEKIGASLRVWAKWELGESVPSRAYQALITQELGKF